ncbi:MAG: phosphopentomutase [Rhizobiales bacterium 65-9]|nr:phosphopentomutase [Hyphomicrobiales bacterium]OJY37330.1 MAG: phosphopentomutase [Rhizobiales bacterium 65-9]
MPRAFIIVMDSVGCGGAEDARLYGDEGADTLGHIAEACARGGGDREGLRKGPLSLPFLASLGLRAAMELSRGKPVPALGEAGAPRGQWGYAVETARGKDTPSGHWEIAGCPVAIEWKTFPDARPAFPSALTDALIREGKIPGILGDRHSNGVAIVEELGAEHVRTGRPIVYTSADSVIQIAAHEDPSIFGLERLYDLCRVGRRLADPLNVGRVIARPFVGDEAQGFTRTANRKDFAVQPPSDTLLDRCAQHRRAVVSLGKIGDIFAHRATGREVKAAGDMALFDKLLEETPVLPDGGFLFANFVDFDSEFGHRRDVPGYAHCLERFDARLPAFAALLKKGDLAIVTADHGNDPTWKGTDHTREHVPLLALGPDLAPRALGRRDSYADIAATVAAHLGLPPVGPGAAW